MKFVLASKPGNMQIHAHDPCVTIFIYILICMCLNANNCKINDEIVMLLYKMSRKTFTKSAKHYNITNNICIFISKEPLKTQDKQRTPDYFFLNFYSNQM